MSIRRFHYLYLALVAGYLLFVAFSPVDPTTVERYAISEMQLRLIGLSISIVVACVWLIALYGYNRFRSYANTIAAEKEGQAFTTLANGLMVLVLSLPLSSAIPAVLRRIVVAHPEFAAAVPITKNYLAVVLHLLAFTLLAKGAQQLVATLRPRVTVRLNTYVVGTVIALSCLFTWMVTARPFGGSVQTTYSLPDIVVLLTIVIPLLFAWYKGMEAVYGLNMYRKKVKGLIYQRMLSSLVVGISLIVTLSILVQVLVSVSEQLIRLNFTPILLIVYAFIALSAAGYGIVAYAARQLKKIEEV